MRLKEKDYGISVNMASNLKTDIARENLLKVIRALKYASNKWKKVGKYYIIEDYEAYGMLLIFL